MRNFFKSIWNFFFGKKEDPAWDCQSLIFAPMGMDESKVCVYCKGKKQIDGTDCHNCKGTGKYFIYPNIDVESYYKIKEDIIKTRLFRKQQLKNKVYNVGKTRFRIINKSTLTHPEKIRYEIIQL